MTNDIREIYVNIVCKQENLHVYNSFDNMMTIIRILDMLICFLFCIKKKIFISIVYYYHFKIRFLLLKKHFFHNITKKYNKKSFLHIFLVINKKYVINSTINYL
ncbi:hypothetical protein EDEG_00927 [Edhazardia aedis USNM 41457]|uniref:Uncharacterized protein n=1 Tax=Edhazardia aedis (strain USNM 41457) TaxID=1003232 RepID=J9DBR7_EDHAE|nr:hypothetical protein EDEG_00927 [Edhazardia aedis USNM 41457]|eukprot:EJW04934.1 hypothetical protein EDEG_00927 [Edhazardia aedis USNM 41457]